MIDIHNHIIYGVDDGSKTIKESIKMILEAEELGVKSIIATPHFYRNAHNAERAAERCRDLASRISGCGVDLQIGYEVLISTDLPELIRRGKKLTMGNSPYLLLELPFDSVPAYSNKVMYELHLENIIPIIAHPERNLRFLSDIDLFKAFLGNGCYVQIDAASIIGIHGKKVRKFAKQLLKLKLVDYIASDAHHLGDYSAWYLQAYRQVSRWEGKEHADMLFKHNPQKIFNESKK